MNAALVCSEETTLTNLIRLNGRQHQDWSPDYRLYGEERVDEKVLFNGALSEVLSVLPKESPLVIALDDTLTRKTGTHIAGVSWKRDPLGPAFQINLVRGQRYVQFSAAWPLEMGGARMIPVAFQHAPPAAKPPKNPNEKQRAEHREEKRQKSLNAYAIKEMKALREICPKDRPLIFCGDGSYTNAEVIKACPESTTYIGRIRKDAALYNLLSSISEAGRNGRPRLYGDKAPTPEQLRQDPEQPWQILNAFASGKRHEFRVKILSNVCWKKTGHQKTFQVMVIAPVGYRLRKGGKLLYRQPAHLICTDVTLPPAELLQYYLWRWGIEVNFRDEKTLLGVGEAHVRTPSANQHLPAVIVAAYSLLWVAALRMKSRGSMPVMLRPARWEKKAKEGSILPSTKDLLRTLQYETWSSGFVSPTFSHFANSMPSATKSIKPSIHQQEVLQAAI